MNEFTKTSKRPIICRRTRPIQMILARETGPGPAAYSWPRHVGSIKRKGKTKVNSPAFTLKGRSTFEWKKEGPGPGAYEVPTGVTRFGYDIGREYSIGPKLPPPKNYNRTPAPIYFPTEMSSNKKSPIGKKLEPFSAYKSPAPNSYTLPPAIGYQLAVYHSDNGFCLKGRVKFGSYIPTSLTPGPVALPEMELWKSNSPQIVIGVRNKVSNKTVGPGPAAYRPAKMNATKSKAPAYHFGCRHSNFVTPFYLKSND